MLDKDKEIAVWNNWLVEAVRKIHVQKQRSSLERICIFVRYLIEKDHDVAQSFLPIYETPIQSIAIVDKVQRHLNRAVKEGLLLKVFAKGVATYKNVGQKSLDRIINLTPPPTESETGKLIRKVLNELTEVETYKMSQRDLTKITFGHNLKEIQEYIFDSHQILYTGEVCQNKSARMELSNIVKKWLAKEVDKGTVVKNCVRDYYKLNVSDSPKLKNSNTIVEKISLPSVAENSRENANTKTVNPSSSEPDEGQGQQNDANDDVVIVKSTAEDNQNIEAPAPTIIMECLMCGNPEFGYNVNIDTMTRHADYTLSLLKILNLSSTYLDQDEELSQCKFNVTYCKSCSLAMTNLKELLAAFEEIKRRMGECRNSIQSKLIDTHDNFLRDNNSNNSRDFNSMACSLRRKIIQGIVGYKEEKENVSEIEESCLPSQSQISRKRKRKNKKSKLHKMIQKDLKLHPSTRLEVCIEKMAICSEIKTDAPAKVKKDQDVLPLPPKKKLRRSSRVTRATAAAANSNPEEDFKNKLESEPIVPSDNVKGLKTDTKLENIKVVMTIHPKSVPEIKSTENSTTPMDNRLKLVREIHICSRCGADFEDDDKYAQHKATHVDDVNPIMEKTKNSKEGTNYVETGGLAYTTHGCGYCNAQYYSTGDIKRHIKAAHGTRAPTPRERIKSGKVPGQSCPFRGCSVLLFTSQQFNRHLEAWHGIALDGENNVPVIVKPLEVKSTPDDGNNSNSYENPDSAQKQEEEEKVPQIGGANVCGYCKDVFPYGDDQFQLIKKHFQEIHSKYPSEDIQIFQCDVEIPKCLMSFYKESHYHFHMEMVHKIPQPEKLICPRKCGFRCRSLDQLNQHVRLHLYSFSED